AKRGNQSRVVGCAMMVDVVRSKGGARQLLQQIVLFIRSAVRADETDRVFAAGIVDALQHRRRGLRGFLPRCGTKLAALANHWLPDALGVSGEIKSKPPLYAKKISVDPAQVAVVRTQNPVVARAQRGLAAIRTMWAYRRNVRHSPRARFIP